ncbi:hypothetical protein KCU79_g163, partial [Aureobasidium melanogenum]
MNECYAVPYHLSPFRCYMELFSVWSTVMFGRNKGPITRSRILAHRSTRIFPLHPIEIYVHTPPSRLARNAF